MTKYGQIKKIIAAYKEHEYSAHVLNPNIREFYKKRFVLELYQQAEWDPDVCLELKVSLQRLTSLLEMMNRDNRGENPDDSSRLEDELPTEDEFSQEVGAALRSNYLLNTIKLDMLLDTSGTGPSQGRMKTAELPPLSGTNWLAVMFCLLQMFENIEEKLEERKNSVYIAAYSTKGWRSPHKRAWFTSAVLSGQDEECMEVIAEVLKEWWITLEYFIYWEHSDQHSGALAASLRDGVDVAEIIEGSKH